MSINISAERQIKEINEEFTGKFPFLKLEFYRHADVQQEKYSADKLMPMEKVLKDVWVSNKDHQNEDGREITETAIINPVVDYDLNPGN